MEKLADAIKEVLFPAGNMKCSNPRCSNLFIQNRITVFCGRCEAAYYCSFECRDAHAMEHAVHCNLIAEHGPFVDKMLCRHCGVAENSETPHKRCGRCKWATYCSQECQKADWKKHKSSCKLVAEKNDENHNAALESVEDRLGEFTQQYTDSIRNVARVALMGDSGSLGNTHFVLLTLDDIPKSFAWPRLEIKESSLHPMTNDLKDSVKKVRGGSSMELWVVRLLHVPSGVLFASFLGAGDNVRVDTEILRKAFPTAEHRDNAVKTYIQSINEKVWAKKTK